MILSDGDIHNRLEEGDLVIEPLADPDLQVQPASVDLRLGREFLEFNRTNIACIHPDREEEVDQYVTSTSVAQGAGDEQTTLVGYDADDRRARNEFILHPGDFVLGTTMERVEIPDDLIAHVEGRSSLGRLAIVVHASLPYDEQVFLWTPGDGYGFYEIGAIVENETPACAVAFDPETLSVRTHKVTDYIVNPKQRIYSVTLQSGRHVHVTKDHNLFTINDAGRVTRVASENAEGEHVMVPGKLPVPQAPERGVDLWSHFRRHEDVIAYVTDGASPRGILDKASHSSQQVGSDRAGTKSLATPANAPDAIEFGVEISDERLPRTLQVTPEFGWIVGFYIATGTMRRSALEFVHQERELLDRVAAWIEQFDARVQWDEERGHANRITIESQLFTTLFKELTHTDAGRTIPARAWNWSDDVLGGLLDGLLDGNRVTGTARESFVTANLDLADQTMYLATRLGRLATVDTQTQSETEPPDGDGSPVIEWRVDITDPSIDDQSIPTPGALLTDLRERAGLSTRDAAADMGYASAASISQVENERHNTVTRSTLRRFNTAYQAAGVDTTDLEQLLTGTIRFEKVTSVERTDRVETTYDLEVQPRGRSIENFIGGRGGIFLSNTAGIVDPGYRGQITLELSNLGTAPVALTPGMRISQLTFTELTSPAERPYGSDRGSKYQDQHGPQASRIQSDHEFLGDQK